MSLRDPGKGEGGVFQEFQDRLKRSGYVVQALTLVASDFGVPQRRERVFIIGAKNGKLAFFLPRPETPKVRDAISDLPPLPEGGGGDENTEYHVPPQSAYQAWAREGSQVLWNHRSTVNQGHLVERFKHVPLGGNWKDIPRELMFDYKDFARIHSHIYKRLRWDAPSVTISATALASRGGTASATCCCC